jgi:hypothetical protein
LFEEVGNGLLALHEVLDKVFGEVLVALVVKGSSDALVANASGTACQIETTVLVMEHCKRYL